MNIKLSYSGAVPVRAFKQDWVKGMEVSIVDILSSVYKTADITDSLLEDFKNTHLLPFGNDFALSLGEGSTGSIKVETGTIAIASSEGEAINRLKELKHSDVVGTIDREKHEMKTNLERKTIIAHIPDAGSTVMTGDDFKASAIILDDRAQPIRVSKTRAEEQKESDSHMADVSRGVIVHNPASNVITGTQMETPLKETGEEPAKKRGRPKKSNKYAAQPTASEPRRISMEMIVENSDKGEAERYIEQCKDVSVLKGARIRFNNVGDHQMITLIDRRLRVVNHF